MIKIPNIILAIFKLTTHPLLDGKWYYNIINITMNVQYTFERH